MNDGCSLPLKRWTTGAGSMIGVSKLSAANKTLNLDAVTSNHIRRILEMTNGRVHGKGGAAELLGINSITLRYRMNQLGIPYGRKSRR